MALLRRFAPLIVSVGVVVALGAVGLLASAGANNKAEALHRRDREVLQQTLAGLGHQYVLFAVKEEFDFASSGSWNLKVGDPADLARLQGYISQSPLLNYGAALMDLNSSPLSAYAVDSAGVPGPSDPGYKPMVAALLARQPGVSSLMKVGDIPVVGLAVPVMVAGTPRAVLVAYWRADSSPLQTYLEQLHYGKTGRGAVLDSNGDVVAATDKALVGHRFDDTSVLKRLPQQRSGFVVTPDRENNEAVSFAPLGIGGWSSVTEQSATEFFGPLKSGRQHIDLALLAVLAVAALALAVLNHKRHTASEREEEALRRSEERFRSLVQNGFDVVSVYDADGTVVYDSPAIERVLGYTPEERLGQNAFDYLHPDDRGRARDIIVRVLETPRVLMQLEIRGRRSDGSWRWLEVGITNLLDDPTVGGIVANMRDITERRAFQEQLTHQAYHDPLTLLPNRALFQSRLEVALARANRRKRTIAVLFVDLDRFKIINDSLGHETGDELLRAVADRLQDEVRDEDIVARLSGDEFTVLLEEVESDVEVARVAQRMIEAIRKPIDLGGHQVFVGASIGIALSHNGEDRAEDLLRDADLAMYRAKERGRSRYEIFETTMGARARLRLDLEAELRRALDGDELVLHYQPEVCLLTGEILGTEALVRWQHPERSARPRLVHPHGRGDGPHPRRRPPGAGEGVPAGGQMEAALRRRRAPAHERERLRAPAPDAAGRCQPGVGEHRARPALARAGDHRERGDGRPRGRHPHPSGRAGDGRAARHRRLRHRVLLAELAEALPDLDAEARQVLRAGPGRGPRRPGHRPVGADHGQLPRGQRDGRRHRDAGSGRGARRSRVPLRAGLPLRPPPVGHANDPPATGEDASREEPAGETAGQARLAGCELLQRRGDVAVGLGAVGRDVGDRMVADEEAGLPGTPSCPMSGCR